MNIFRGKFYSKMRHFLLNWNSNLRISSNLQKRNAFKPVTEIFNLLTTNEKTVFDFVMMEI